MLIIVISEQFRFKNKGSCTIACLSPNSPKTIEQISIEWTDGTETLDEMLLSVLISAV